jgi:curved DNA-binding protein
MKVKINSRDFNVPAGKEVTTKFWVFAEAATPAEIKKTYRPNGDLFLAISIAPHPEFQRKGNDLHCDFPVELYSAVLGGKTQVRTLKGMVRVNIPKETPNGTVLKLRGLGMPLYGRKNEFGNLFVKIDIRTPAHLSEQEIDLFGKLAALRN